MTENPYESPRSDAGELRRLPPRRPSVLQCIVWPLMVLISLPALCLAYVANLGPLNGGYGLDIALAVSSIVSFVLACWLHIRMILSRRSGRL